LQIFTSHNREALLKPITSRFEHLAGNRVNYDLTLKPAGSGISQLAVLITFISLGEFFEVANPNTNKRSQIARDLLETELSPALLIIFTQCLSDL